MQRDQITSLALDYETRSLSLAAKDKSVTWAFGNIGQRHPYLCIPSRIFRNWVGRGGEYNISYAYIIQQTVRPTPPRARYFVKLDYKHAICIFRPVPPLRERSPLANNELTSCRGGPSPHADGEVNKLGRSNPIWSVVRF